MHQKKKKESIKSKPDNRYVHTSRTKESTADFDHPLDLDTILELSAKGILKETNVKPKKVA
jgi:hypothetical protein